jgi:hypothetical protein
MTRKATQTSAPASPAIPPASELFNKRQMVERHPNLLSPLRLEWALRQREINGLTDIGAVFETKGGEIYIHEPSFLAWFLGLTGRNKPRALRRHASA